MSEDEKERAANRRRMTGDQLRELREMAEWSQVKMGKALGISQSEVSLMEAGKKPIPREFSLSVKSRMLRYNERELEIAQAVRARIAGYDFKLK